MVLESQPTALHKHWYRIYYKSAHCSLIPSESSQGVACLFVHGKLPLRASIISASSALYVSSYVSAPSWRIFATDETIPRSMVLPPRSTQFSNQRPKTTVAIKKHHGLITQDFSVCSTNAKTLAVVDIFCWRFHPPSRQRSRTPVVSIPRCLFGARSMASESNSARNFPLPRICDALLPTTT